jgi:catechol 2,3-dioxygenase-like lactoylglutathione lyase family enzyme
MAEARLTSLALRVHHMDAMVAFYADAFGARFREVPTGPLTSRFAEVGGVTLKFVPIRDAADFAGFPVHQPGFEVEDVERVLVAAAAHGGAIQDAPREGDGRLHAAVRDPDGNTLEIYGPTRQR